jgi:hypothetical protein
MKKIFFPLGMVLILLLSACGQAAATPTTMVKPTETTAPTTVSTPSTTEPCKLTKLLPDPAAIPPVTDGDWSKGNKDAQVVVIEYSDFQ